MDSNETPRRRSLDRIDRAILRTLQEQGRLAFVDLAQAVGLSTSPCIERVRRLEKDGYILGYHAQLDAVRLGSGMTVFVEISLDYTSPDIFDQFRRAVRTLPQVQACHLVSGNFDYLLKVRIADIHAYRDLLGQLLQTLPGVRDSRSFVVMEAVKDTLAVTVPR